MFTSAKADKAIAVRSDWLRIFGLTNQLLCFCLAVDGHSEERERERERLDNKTGIMRRGRALVRSLC